MSKKVDWLKLGGAPTANDDWWFQDEGHAETTKGALSFLGTDFYLSGKYAIIGGNVVYASDYVCLNGEILKVTNTMILQAFPYIYIEIDEQNDVGGDRTFENSTFQNIWKKRTAKYVGYATAQTGKILADSLQTADQIINANVANAAHSFTKVQAFSFETAGISPSYIEIAFPLYSSNVYRLYSSTALTGAISGFSGFVEGAMYFFCCENIKVRLRPSIGNGTLSTPNNADYLFEEGESFMLMAIGGVVRLITDKAAHDDWHTVEISGEIIPNAPWSNTSEVKFKKIGDWVTVIGNISTNYYNSASPIVFQLPVGYRPVDTLGFTKREMFHLGWCDLTIGSNGNVSVSNSTVVSGTPCGINCGSIVFTVK
jgi:hypothetical protein